MPLATTVPSAALQMRVKGLLGEGALLRVRITQDADVTSLCSLDVLPDIFGIFTFCFPPETLGRSASITMDIYTATAERTLDLTADIDDVAIVAAPTSCP